MATKPKPPTVNTVPFGGVKEKGPAAMLPSRHALDLLTKGNPSQRTIASFGARTPIGAGAPRGYAKIFKGGF